MDDETVPVSFGGVSHQCIWAVKAVCVIRALERELLSHLIAAMLLHGFKRRASPAAQARSGYAAGHAVRA
jgi:hypothetical protein